MTRNVHDRIEWFRTHKPAQVGYCLNHTWLATDVPATGNLDANAGVAYVKGAGYMRTTRNPPRGAWVWYTSATHGHVALALGDGTILSTDVDGPATTGTALLSYPETAWGHKYAGWADWYGVPFHVGDDKGDDDMPLSKDDLERIAHAVWSHEFENTTNMPNERKPARWFLNAILDKVKGK